MADPMAERQKKIDELVDAVNVAAQTYATSKDQVKLEDELLVIARKAVGHGVGANVEEAIRLNVTAEVGAIFTAKVAQAGQEQQEASQAMEPKDIQITGLDEPPKPSEGGLTGDGGKIA